MFLPNRWSGGDTGSRCYALSLAPQESSEGRVGEVRPSVTNYHPWCAKPWEDNLVEHLTSVLCICGPAWHGFDPFGDVVYGDQDVLVTLGFHEGSHVVDAPNVEKFDLKVIS